MILVSAGLSHTEQLVVDLWHGLDWRRSESQGFEPPVRFVEILDHQVEGGIARDDCVLCHQDEVRSSTQLEHRDAWSGVHGPHPDLAHERGGLLEPSRLENHVSDPHGGP